VRSRYQPWWLGVALSGPRNAGTIHAAELYRAGHGSDEALRIWEYLPFGPWPDEAAFLAWLRDQAATFDHIWFAHGRTKAKGASHLDIHPLDGVIEIGGIWFGTELQRTRATTEALFLLLCGAALTMVLTFTL